MMGRLRKPPGTSGVRSSLAGAKPGFLWSEDDSAAKPNETSITANVIAQIESETELLRHPVVQSPADIHSVGVWTLIRDKKT